MTMGADFATSVRRATPGDAAPLAALAATTFRDAFEEANDPADMAAYLESAFGESIQARELRDPRITVFLAERDRVLVGYAMLREGGAPACVDGHDPIEISRLYATTGSIGTGVGAALMQRCLAEARARHRRTVWLGVWERNARAIAFYRRWGFEVVGEQFFALGRDRQSDRVMACRLEEAH